MSSYLHSFSEKTAENSISNFLPKFYYVLKFLGLGLSIIPYLRYSSFLQPLFICRRKLCIRDITLLSKISIHHNCRGHFYPFFTTFWMPVQCLFQCLFFYHIQINCTLNRQPPDNPLSIFMEYFSFNNDFSVSLEFRWRQKVYLTFR